MDIVSTFNIDIRIDIILISWYYQIGDIDNQHWYSI